LAQLVSSMSRLDSKEVVDCMANLVSAIDILVRAQNGDTEWWGRVKNLMLALTVVGIGGGASMCCAMGLQGLGALVGQQGLSACTGTDD
jgi:precorrin-4 methylase